MMENVKGSKRLSKLGVLANVKNSGRSVFNVIDFSKLNSISIHAASITMELFVKEGIAIRLRRGQISFSTDASVNATQMIEPSYITGWTAFSLYRMTDQESPYLHLATTQKSLTIDDLNLKYHKIPPDLFFGFEKVMTEDGSFFNMATKEKALIDAIYLGLGSDRTLYSLKRRGIDNAKLKNMVLAYEGRRKKHIMEVLML